MSLIHWEPLREFDDLFRQYANTVNRRPQLSKAEWKPIANISETDKEYLIKAELPEVKKEDIKVQVENGVLTISGERKQQKEEKSENEIRVESFYGTFSRSFALPDHVDAKAVTAESKDGVLRVRVPKQPPAQPKAITVNVA